jgi:hypothetical protein
MMDYKMGGTCSKYGRDENYIYKILVTKPEDLGIERWRILEWILRK